MAGYNVWEDPAFLKRLDKRLDDAAKRLGLPTPKQKPVAMTARTEIDYMAKRLMKEKGMSRQAAMKEIFRRDPSLRQSLVRQANRRR